jgi:hypothetical protein
LDAPVEKPLGGLGGKHISRDDHHYGSEKQARQRFEPQDSRYRRIRSNKGYRESIDTDKENSMKKFFQSNAKPIAIAIAAALMTVGALALSEAYAQVIGLKKQRPKMWPRLRGIDLI